MTIENVNIVDSIGTDLESKKVILTISDHLEWANDEHLLLLQEKLNTYIQFVESGELRESYPVYEKSFNVEFSLICKHKPTEKSIDVLKKFQSALAEMNIEFKYEVISD